MESRNQNTTEASSTGAPPKFSRYRSVRAKAASEPCPPPAPVPAPSEQSNDLKRAPSRYRRNRAATNVDAPPLPTTVPQSQSNARIARRVVVGNHGAEEIASPTRIVPAGDKRRVRDRSNTTGPPASGPPSREKRREVRTNVTTSDPPRPSAGPRTYDAAREEARMILEGEFDRMQKLKKMQAQRNMSAGSGAPDMRRRPTTTRDQGKDGKSAREEVQQTTPKEVMQLMACERTEQEPQGKQSLPAREIRHLVIGGGGNAPPQLHKQVVENKGHSGKTSKAPESEWPSQMASNAAQVIPASSISEAVKTFDAPISAVNAGDRRVEVRCSQATITLPVTPSTTVKDLLNSASVVMSEKVDPKSGVLMEAFSYLGLERPLRRYERIRDVMNSWDADIQHHLEIMPGSECSAPGLDVRDAPSVAPLETRVHLYHSLSPAKWDKRWLTLREDGQVTVSKHESGKESTNICHLSDFDLYTPTAKQKKKLRTPKKICFAVKSQQKAAMFLEGQNFAHFFCSNQKEITDKWYKALHSWRSWYLVNVLGEGQQKPATTRRFSLSVEKRPGTAQSQDTVRYQLGSFKPLLDMGSLPFESHNGSGETQRGARRSLDIHAGSPKRFPRNDGLPPSAFRNRPVLDAMEQSPHADEETQPFTGTGLLARSASRRTQGGQGTGRGVPAPRGKPMVDLSAESDFVDGSLLRKLEAWAVQNGDAEPKIDREKRVEASIKVGERA